MLKGSPRKDEVYKFLEFINRPEIQAQLPDEIAYGVVRKEASKSIKPERLIDIPSNPKNLEVSIPPNSQFWLENNDRLTERLQAWAAK